MADNQQQYPDSNGARWEAQTSGGRPGPAERPAFLDRTEPMSRQEREARAADSSLDDLMGGRNRTSRLPSQERGEEFTGGFAAPRGPETPVQPWSQENPPMPPQMGEPATGDPELAAVSRMDAPRHVPPPMPPQMGETAPRPPMAQPSGPPAMGHPSPPPPPMGQPSPPPVDLNEPTQMHNPVASAPPAQQRGGGYGGTQGGGVYQSNKSSLGPVVWIAALVMVIPIAYVMVRSLASGAGVSAGAVAAGVFALAGLPLTAFGLQAVLNVNSGETPSPWRAPYVYLVLGLVLVLAAGMAAG